MIYKTNSVSEEYSDILNLPHHELTTRKRMSRTNRAASFSPFAALTGFEDEVKETARLTDDKPELDEDRKLILNYKLQIALMKSDEQPVIKVSYFLPDKKKTGGSYVDYIGTIKKIDEYAQKIIFIDKTEIPIDDILNVDGEIYNSIY